MPALDVAAPLAIVAFAFLLLLWGGYVVPGTYTPRTAALDGGHGITMLCPRLRC